MLYLLKKFAISQPYFLAANISAQQMCGRSVQLSATSCAFFRQCSGCCLHKNLCVRRHPKEEMWDRSEIGTRIVCKKITFSQNLNVVQKVQKREPFSRRQQEKRNHLRLWNLDINTPTPYAAFCNFIFKVLFIRIRVIQNKLGLSLPRTRFCTCVCHLFFKKTKINQSF